MRWLFARGISLLYIHLLRWSRVAEAVRRHKGLSPESLDFDENFKHQHTLCILSRWKDLLRFTYDWLFGRLEAKKCFFFGTITAFLGQEVHYYMVFIAYYTEMTLQICSYGQKRRICRKNRKYTTGEIFLCEQPLWQIFFALAISMKRRSPKVQTGSTQVPSSALNRRSRTMTLIEGKNIFEFL